MQTQGAQGASNTVMLKNGRVGLAPKKHRRGPNTEPATLPPTLSQAIPFVCLTDRPVPKENSCAGDPPHADEAKFYPNAIGECITELVNRTQHELKTKGGLTCAKGQSLTDNATWRWTEHFTDRYDLIDWLKAAPETDDRVRFHKDNMATMMERYFCEAIQSDILPLDPRGREVLADDDGLRIPRSHVWQCRPRQWSVWTRLFRCSMCDYRWAEDFSLILKRVMCVSEVPWLHGELRSFATSLG
jgi:hypothetical protein